MNRFAIASSLALTVALVGSATSAQEEQVQPSAEADGFVELTGNDVFATQIFGMAVLAPDSALEGSQIQDIDTDEGFEINQTDLAGFQYVGRVTDVMLSRSGEARAVVITQMTDTTGTGTAAPQAVDPTVLQVPPAADMPLPGTMPEIAIDLERIAFVSDATVPDVIFAVIDVSMDQFYNGPVLDRFAGGAHAPGWHGGRGMMAAPTVATPGFAHIPTTEVSADDLIGAPLYANNYEHVGSIGDVVLSPDGEAEYLTVDIGGFLGFGAHEVAIGFDEITVLRSTTVGDLEVHISATRGELEALPEYPG